MIFKRIIFLATLASMPAFAQDSGPFISASVGQLRTSFNGLPANFSADDTSTSWAIGGGYRFNKYLGLDAGYRDFGKLATHGPTTTTTKGTAWTFGGLASYPLTESVDLVARAGWYRWKAKADNMALNYHAENTGTEPYWGAGLSYAVTPKASIGANWTRFKSAYASADDADVFELGLQYRF